MSCSASSTFTCTCDMCYGAKSYTWWKCTLPSVIVVTVTKGRELVRGGVLVTAVSCARSGSIRMLESQTVPVRHF